MTCVAYHYHTSISTYRSYIHWHKISPQIKYFSVGAIIILIHHSSFQFRLALVEFCFALVYCYSVASPLLASARHDQNLRSSINLTNFRLPRKLQISGNTIHSNIDHLPSGTSLKTFKYGFSLYKWVWPKGGILHFTFRGYVWPTQCITKTFVCV